MFSARLGSTKQNIARQKRIIKKNLFNIIEIIASIALIWLAITCGFIQKTAVSLPNSPQLTYDSQQLLKDAFVDRRSNIQVKGEGKVIKLQLFI
ncbi:MAG: hypothetical protein ACRC2R_26490 [Xenococcaceae cyanobacterium]